LTNIKKQIQKSEEALYTNNFDKLHQILLSANNEYIKSFQVVKDYVEKHLKDKCLNVKLCIHANESADKLLHRERLNAPTVNEIAILMPDDDVITKDHNR